MNCVGTFVNVKHMAIEWCDIHNQQARACALFDESSRLRKEHAAMGRVVELAKGMQRHYSPEALCVMMGQWFVVELNAALSRLDAEKESK